MTPTPNPTAEPLKSWEVNSNAWEAFADEEHMTNGIQAAYEAGLRAHGLLSEGAPSEEQIERAAEAMIDASPDVTRETVSDEEFAWYLQDARAALTASGAAPQEPQALDPEKVKAWLQREFGSVLAHDPHNPDRFWGGSADALCVAYTEGKLT